jgi:hypothetical protein
LFHEHLVGLYHLEAVAIRLTWTDEGDGAG